ncbi:MAG: hypothetical protein JXO72_00535 [Vicinamibacteria bacterium]|nr:hypothetical protein [Vicinamibacteria bacterium]
MTHRKTLLPILLLTVSFMCACEEEVTDATSEESVFTFSPYPAIAEQSSGVTYTIKGDDTHPDQIIEYPWKTSFTVIVQETAGVGRYITAMSLKVQQASGGIVITPVNDIEHYQYNSQASGNRIEGNGTATVGFEAWYDLPNEGREALITVTFTFKDDNDLSFAETASIMVQ